MEYFTLSNGLMIPKIGIGTNTFGKLNNEYSGEITMDTKELLTAYENGYQLVDTAVAYRNEAVIGKSIIDANLIRQEVIITSKFPSKNLADISDEEIIRIINESIRNIGSYIDIYLIHHPTQSNELNLKIWRQLENYYKNDHIKAIGVSNFNEEQLTYLMNHAEIKPMINQIESNPGNWQNELIKFCQNNNILVTAWGPLDPVPNKEVFEKIGYKYQKTWAQVLLKYQISRGVLVIPKSHNKIRQFENINIFDFTLSDDDIKEIES
ncbi:aldo/keto reductase family protein [Acholeplasma granularum]|uniref:aldo/keto reductase family protein n=1 Tax=Acholeplasma granularum TaxID=264635 RepID=UPI000471F6BA|nr:aldo/keto reductase [Acholeplasma granularum]